MRTLALFVVALTSAACTITTSESSRPAAPPPPPGPPPAAFAQNAGRAPMGVRVIHTARKPNIQRLRALKARGSFCAPEEVAGGTWAKFDCQPYSPIRRALPMNFAALLNPTNMAPTMGGGGLPFPFPIPGLPGMPGQGGQTRGTVGNLPSGPIPAAVDLRTANLDGPIKDQGAVGTCTAVSLSTAMEVAIRKQAKPDVVSPLHVWSQYAMPNMGVAGDSTENQTLATESSWGYDPAKACAMMKIPADDCGEAYGVTSGSGAFDPVLQGEKRQADGAGKFKLTQVEEFSKPTNPEEMAAVLAGGDAIWIALSVDPASWKTSNMRDGVIPDYSQVGQTGHAVTFVGYRTTSSGKQFLIHNSWGEKWGQGGYGWISENMVRNYTRNAYKVVVDGQSGPNPGGGTNPPASNGCPAGQMKDAVSGQCANACPSGSAPAAGVCLPAVPGFPRPGGGQPNNQGGGCPQGQVKDSVSGQCGAACPSGSAPMGGLCMPGAAPGGSPGGLPGGFPPIPGFPQ
jgi:hypothetical protein